MPKPTTYKFLRQQTGEWEQVSEEIWQWQAQYDDGTTLKQFDDEGVFHQFTEIDQEKLSVFRMVSSQHPNSYTLVFDPSSMKLIHFYRNTVLNMLTEAETRVKLYCFGFEKKIKNQTSKVIMAITPSNELVILEDIATLKVG
jgi:hypothetical protein